MRTLPDVELELLVPVEAHWMIGAELFVSTPELQAVVAPVLPNPQGAPNTEEKGHCEEPHARAEDHENEYCCRNEVANGKCSIHFLSIGITDAALKIFF